MNALAPVQSVAPALPVSPGVDDVDPREVQRLRDTRAPIRLGFWVLVVGLGLFLAWAAWAPLNEGVSAPGSVAVESRRTTIQHMQGGVVKAVHVKDGAEVRAGDLLIELDDATARAGLQSVRQNYQAQRALESRLLAELGNQSSISFHPDLLSSADPLAAQHMAVQRQLFASRRAALQAEIASGQQSIVGFEQQIAGTQQVVRERRAQLDAQAQQLANVRQLANEGFAPRNQALQLEQTQAELRASITNLENEQQRLRSAVAETRIKITGRNQEFLKETSAQLADVRREVQANQEKMAAGEGELSRLQIRAPTSGQVIGLTVRNVGGIVQHGQPLLDILPRGSQLVIDVKVPPQSISQIAVGNDVEVRFAAFASKPHLVVMGKLVSLSGDVVTEQVGGVVSSHYTGQVVLTPEGMKALDGEIVQPGMTADVMIRTGERTLLQYMLGPLLKRASGALTER